MDVRGTLSRGEIASFLEDAVVPVRVACRTPSDRLWMLSLWFLYRDERLYCATAKQADVVGFLDHDPRVAFEISTNEPPYAGVRGRGSTAVTDDPEKTLLRELLDRYLGSTDSPTGRRLLREERDEVTVEITPDVVYGWDFSDRMREDVE